MKNKPIALVLATMLSLSALTGVALAKTEKCVSVEESSSYYMKANDAYKSINEQHDKCDVFVDAFNPEAREALENYFDVEDFLDANSKSTLESTSELFKTAMREALQKVVNDRLLSQEEADLAFQRLETSRFPLGALTDSQWAQYKDLSLAEIRTSLLAILRVKLDEAVSSGRITESNANKSYAKASEDWNVFMMYSRRVAENVFNMLLN